VDAKFSRWLFEVSADGADDKVSNLDAALATFVRALVPTAICTPTTSLAVSRMQAMALFTSDRRAAISASHRIVSLNSPHQLKDCVAGKFAEPYVDVS